MTEVETGFPATHTRRGYRSCVLNQKGGVGKTGLASGAAGALAERGRYVLLVDVDPQGHLTTEALGLDDVEPGKPNFARLLTGDNSGVMEGITINDLIVRHSDHPSGGRVDVVPTCAEMFLVEQQMYKGRGRMLEWTLDTILSDLFPVYDHIIMDCPPALNLMTDNVLVAADGVVIPVQLARTSLRALILLLQQLSVLEDELKLPRRELLGLVPSLYRRPLSGYARYVAPEIEAFAKPGPAEPGQLEVPPVPILAHLPLGTAVEEAWLQGEMVVDYVPNSPQAEGLRRVAVRLDVAAGLAEPEEWEQLGELPSLVPPRSASIDAVSAAQS